MHTWLHLIYKIPRNPTSSRVYIWRKLKRLGALLLHDAVWCLPANPRTVEQFQWLVVEIQELSGEAMLWESKLVMGIPEEQVVKKFLDQVDADYLEILSELGQEEKDIVALTRRYQQVKSRDYFHSEKGKQTQQALIRARGGESQ